MKFIRTLLLAICVMTSGTHYAFADATHGTKEEAQAMCEKAADLIKKEGAEKAFPILQSKDGGFFDRDLYVFIVDGQGVYKVHSAKPALVGTNRIDMKDPAGFPLVKAFTEVKDKAWVDYKWPDSSDNNKIKDKSSWIIHTGDYFVGVGYYKS